MARLSSSLTALLCCMSLCTSGIEGQSGEGGGGKELYSGSGSGSGRDMDEGEGIGVEGKVAECVDDLPREEDEGGDLISSTAYTAAMCSLLCMENVTSNPLHKDIELVNETVGGVWMFKSFPKFSSENVNTNCNAYREFAECVRGCLVRVEPAAAQFTGRQCKSECVDQCNDEKDIDSLYFNPYCDIKCKGLVCIQGCNNYQWIVRSSNTPGSPPSPRQGPEVVSSSKNGDINISISQSAPSTNDPGRTPSSVGIVYRVVDNATNVTRYFYKVSPDEPLSLFEFACRPVSLSFALVNRFGLSQETSPLSFTVPGGEIHVRPPAHVQVRVEVDRRPGFFGHAVLTISWSHPKGYIEGRHQYVVKVQRYNSNQSYTSPPLTTTSLTVSDGERGSVFLLGGDVRIKVCTQLGESEECEEEKQQIQNVNRIWGNPVKITDCIPRWDGSHFNIILHWTVPEFVAYGKRIFSSFLIAAEERLTKRFIDSIIVYKKPNQTSYSYTWLGLPPLNSQRRYEFRVSIQWLDSNDYRKPDTVDAKCSILAVPPPPSPVLDVTLSELQLSNGEIEFLVQWSPPATHNSRITHYLACLGGRKLTDFEKNPDTPVDGNDTSCQEIENKERSFTWKNRAPRPDCLYFQIRAHAELGEEGEWSEAVVISDKAISSEKTCSKDPGSSLPLQSKRDSSETSYVPVVGAVGAVVALTALVLLTVLTVVCGRIRRRKRRIRHVLARQTSDEADLMFTGGAKKSLASQKQMLITADEWEIPPEQVIVEGNIGEGAFGEVLKGTVKGPLSNPKVPRVLKTSICIPVAIKMLKTSAKGSERRDFLQEIEMMKKVSEGQNPHVVSMVGCVTLQEPLSLITEFVPYGNLLQYLRTNQRLYTDRAEGEDDASNNYTDLGNINPTDLISFAYQIASGMEYLSSLGIVHRDLAARNILVGEGKVLKITDLGMSRETDEVYVQKTKGRVPLKWMAVESIITREFTSSSDVWAYSVVLWEIGTLGGFPYPSIQNEDLLPLLKRGYRMEKPENCSSEVYAIMLECWQEDPGKRPTFSQLRGRFDSMLLAEKKDTYIDLQIDASKPYYNPELASDAEVLDSLLRLSPNPGKMVSATSPFHLRGISPSHSDFTDSPVSQRSPRSQSPVQVPEKSPGPASLQPTKERKNVYVDNPSSVQHAANLLVTFRGQRSPRDRSPATGQGGGVFPRPASLQLVTENRNVYVDTPSGRRSVHVTSPPHWSSSGYQSVPMAGINLDGATGWGMTGGRASESDDVNEQGGILTMPEILISLN